MTENAYFITGKIIETYAKVTASQIPDLQDSIADSKDRMITTQNNKAVFLGAVATTFPSRRYSQTEITKELSKAWERAGKSTTRLEAMHSKMGVNSRYITLALEDYVSLSGHAQRNDIWQKEALSLMERAISEVVEKTKAPWQDIGMFITSTVTGISIPSLDAKLMNRLPFPDHCKRVPILGLGCLAGVAGINRAADYLRTYPKNLALLSTVELCSLTWHSQDFNVSNIVGTGLFGDGCGAVLLVGEEHPLAKSSRLKLLGDRSAFFKDTERVMGFDIDEEGFRIVLSGDVPSIVRDLVPSVIMNFLGDHHANLSDLNFFVVHPGGPKVIDTFAEILQIKREKLHLSVESLANYGNLSSVSVFTVLKEILAAPPKTGALGLMAALGPGFCAEMSLLEAV